MVITTWLNYNHLATALYIEKSNFFRMYPFSLFTSKHFSKKDNYKYLLQYVLPKTNICLTMDVGWTQHLANYRKIKLFSFVPLSFFYKLTFLNKLILNIVDNTWYLHVLYRFFIFICDLGVQTCKINISLKY